MNDREANSNMKNATENAAVRSPDRIGDYLIKFMDEYLFDQLTDDYLERIGMKDILSGVPVPFKKTELGNLTGINLARSMAAVIGCNSEFEHAQAYKKFIEMAFNGEFVKPLLGEGVKLAEKGELERACLIFRAAINIDPENSEALYCYARACRDCYEAGEGSEYIGRFKAEALEAFEKLTMSAPDFDMGHYYLGYAYLNLGLYIKAKLSFETFMNLTDDEHIKKAIEKIPEGSPVSPESIKEERRALREDVAEWLNKLDEPVKIETAYNQVLAGRYEQGIEMLEPYVNDDAYNKWWPLYLYLGISYEAISSDEKAEWAYKKVLELSPSNTDAMEGLVRIGHSVGNDELVSKYEEKIKIVKRNREEERAAKNKNYN
ncbi:MAG: hypothetical protein J5928_01285 [Firmicutes bacterium]|nr:hypothetical protein [Bacillota bacterium]